METKVNNALQVARLENEVLVYRSRVEYLTGNLDESLRTSLQETSEYAQVREALTKYAERVRSVMPEGNR